MKDSPKKRKMLNKMRFLRLQVIESHVFDRKTVENMKTRYPQTKLKTCATHWKNCATVIFVNTSGWRRCVNIFCKAPTSCKPSSKLNDSSKQKRSFLLKKTFKLSLPKKTFANYWLSSTGCKPRNRKSFTKSLLCNSTTCEGIKFNSLHLHTHEYRRVFERWIFISNV